MYNIKSVRIKFNLQMDKMKTRSVILWMAEAGSVQITLQLWRTRGGNIYIRGKKRIVKVSPK